MIRYGFILLCLLVTSALAQDANITSMEYYIDNDPGVGAATAITITSGTPQDVNINIPTGSLSIGFHVLVIRALDVNGEWGMQDSRHFYVNAQNVTTQADIVAFEYFFDTDPGFGNGTSIPVTVANTLDMQAIVATNALSGGFHAFNIRALDSDGAWGITHSRTLYVDAVGQLSGIEFFIDTDPGIGSATQIAISPPQSTIDMDVTIPTSSLTNGSYTLGMRISDTNGNYSFTQSIAFNICNAANADFTTSAACVGSPTDFTDTSTGTMAGDTYSWDFDSDGLEDDNTVGNTSFTYPAAGSYTASLIIDRSGCRDSVAFAVDVEGLPTANAGSDQNICTDNTILSAVAAGANETGAWSVISGTGTLADTNDPTTGFSNITSSSNQLRWTVTNDLAGCSDNDDVIITSNQPISTSSVNATASLGQTTNTDVQSAANINPGDALMTSIIGQPGKGTASVLNDGTIDYTPNDGTVGMDTVFFQLCNQCGNCVNSFLAIDIQNNPPTITPGTLSVDPGGTVSIDLLSITSDINNNLDPSSLRIVQQPISGANASIDGAFNLIVDYTGVVFVGTDEIGIEACDLAGECATSIISIDVNLPGEPPITVFNAISPNGDEKHDFLEIENITAYKSNSIVIFNRWGRKVYEGSPYDNDQIKFDGTGNVGGAKDLPGGTYFYRLDLGNGIVESGFLVLKN